MHVLPVYYPGLDHCRGRATRRMTAALVFAAACISTLPASAEEERPLLLIFDFDSPFDENREGKRVAAILRARARKTKEFLTLEDLDFEEAVRKKGLEAPAAKGQQALRDFARECHAALVVWGEVSREGEAFKILAKVMDLSADGEPGVVEHALNAQGRQGIPRACEGLLRAVLNRAESPAAAVEESSAEADKAWIEGPNLCSNWDFEKGDPFPLSWRVLRQDCVAFVSGSDAPGRGGRCLKYDMPESVAANQGIMTFSAPIRIEAGGTYRLEAKALTQGPSLIFFVKGYAWLKGTGEETQSWREVWNRKQSLQARAGEWSACRIDLHPAADVIRKGEPIPAAHRMKFVRVGLYAYWPQGVVYWDDVALKKIIPAAAEFQEKVKKLADADSEAIPEIPED